ncbi:hypothetical protein [Enterococcus phage vB_OCPT_Ben]|uniref:Uncharacterized protein n=3 Tax=Schiekvirus TaxID=2732968 RepID=A0AAE9K7N2_9CAUD|nr:hypothetical protein [Enterococcus phage vB_OCPT_Ben]QNL31100.1 hypothetical protein A2_32 [Enterococcus phage vB_EfaM_A2]UKM17389.1 hypothetical protein [Enterococcus phage UTI-EfS3]UNZ10657.1 hypothetical protein DIEEDFHO_00026 [Enterococcus phage vB_OCPT_Bill]
MPLYVLEMKHRVTGEITVKGVHTTKGRAEGAMKNSSKHRPGTLYRVVPYYEAVGAIDIPFVDPSEKGGEN